jgi:hypothetical protein
LPTEITGGSAIHREIVERAHAHVIATLPSNATIPVRIVFFPFSFPPGTEARSTPRGVEILTRSMNGLPGRAEYLLYEEIAHHIAADHGLPHDGNAGMFLQELFAGYVKFSLARQHQPQLMEYLDIPEIGTTGWQRFYGFGTDLGALLAGMQQVEPIIRRFLTTSAVPETIRTKGTEVLSELTSRTWQAPVLLRRCIDIHPELRESWDLL